MKAAYSSIEEGTAFLRALTVVADRQKSAWRKAKENKEHDEKFITKGLWGISRHPKYVHGAISTYDVLIRMA